MITNTADCHFLAWRYLGRRYRLIVKPSMEVALRGIPRLAALTLILEKNKVRHNFSDAEMSRLCEEKNAYYNRLIAKMSEADILPGILDFLKACKASEIKLGLVSSSLNAPKILEKLGLTAYFDCIVDPSTVAEGKPSPDIFLKAVTQLGVSVTECIGIEDAASGIAAINAAGIFSVGIGSEKVLSKAKLLLRNTCELSLELFN
ncbi:beta-phosphoglucomutase [Lactococcus piscium]|uniref:Beta-phosphoglucomutase n=1 Tax=Pseudolactococcus piscium TaxID=1364 RepID=A0A2A5RXA0_9LACT|nr:beta-phosphoglucomutase [Lactococcus piscium]